MKEQLILASNSPRRREYLALLGLPYQSISTDIQEQTQFRRPHLQAMDVAKQKAMAVQLPDSLVIGADTIVVAEGEVMGKPKDREDARRMLTMLSGKRHAVYTGVCLYRPNTGEIKTDYCKTDVWVDALTEQEIEAYLQTGEPFDKAGAYAIQGRFAPYIRKIDGCYFNVVGLPIRLVYRMLQEMNG